MSRIAGMILAATAIATFGVAVATAPSPDHIGGSRVVADGYGWGTPPQASAIATDSPLDDGYGWG